MSWITVHAVEVASVEDDSAVGRIDCGVGVPLPLWSQCSRGSTRRSVSAGNFVN